jgi:hypothetical protein
MKAHITVALAAACALLVDTADVSQASAVDVSFTSSGSAGNWLLDFSVTNNIGGDYAIYFFNVALSSTDIVSSPDSNWGFTSANVGTTYNNPWCVFACIIGVSGPDGRDQIIAGIQAGQTLSGFEALDTALGKPNSVAFAVYSASLTLPGAPFVEGTAFRADFNGNNDQGDNNQGKDNDQGNTDPVAPLPAALPLFATGIGGLGFLGWRRKWKAQATA